MKATRRITMGSISGNIVVAKAAYLASAVKKEQYPNEARKEFVFIGRSNVGKSSLINSLANVRNLAKVSGQPGKTQTINFFDMEFKKVDTEDRLSMYFVDLPGYGYAKTAMEKRKIWSAFIREYLLTSQNIQFVCQLIDSRHEPMKSDIEMFQWLVENGLPVLVIATKTDKISKSATKKSLDAIRKNLGVPDLDILPYSSLKNVGRAELLQSIADCCE